MKKLITTLAVIITGITIAILATCSHKETPDWNNPLDPSGANYHPPVVSVMNDTVVAVCDTIRLRAAGKSENSSIAKYVWVIRGVAISTNDSILNYVWNANAAGLSLVTVRAVDKNGLYSNTALCSVDVHQYKPIVTPMRDTVISIYDTLVLICAASDTNGTKLSYLWALDGKTFSDSLDTFQLTKIFADTVTRNAMLKVRDDDGIYSETVLFKITIRLDAPVVTPMADTSVSIFDTVQLHAAATDPNGSITKYVWALDGVNFRDTTAAGAIQTVFVADGVKSVLVKALDDDRITSAPVTITVTVRRDAPVVTAMADTSVYIADSIMLHASAFDPNGTILRFLWARDSINYRDTTAVGLLRILFTGSGKKTIGVRVQDDDGIFSAPVFIHVLAVSDTPTVTAMPDTSVAIFDPVSYRAVGKDANGTIAWYFWAVDNGAFAESTTVGIITKSFADSGNHLIRVKVRDNDGLVSAMDTIKTRVLLYAPTITAMQDTTVAIFDSVRYRATGTDANGSVVKYVWAMDNGAFAETTSVGVLAKAFIDSGNHSIRVRAVDDDGFVSVADTIKTRVLLYAPTVVMMADTSVSIYDTVTVHAAGADVNGSVVRYLWAVNGSVFSDSTNTGRIKTVFADTGKKRVVVRVRDDDGQLSPPDTVILTVRLDAPTIITMNDTAVAPNDSFTIWATGKDTNGTIQKYYWALDGVAFNDSTAAGLIKTAFATTGIHPVKIKARDDDGIFSAVTTIKVTALVDTPSVAAMRDTAVSIYDTIRISAKGTDVNGTISKYFWIIDNAVNADSSVDSFIRHVFVTAGEHSVVVRVRDDSGVFSAGDTVVVRVRLDAPVVVAMRDTAISVFDTIRITAKGTDANGTIMKYYWAVDVPTPVDSSTDSSIKRAFTTDGLRRVIVWVKDDDGLISLKDTVLLTIRLDAPTVIAMNDSSVFLDDTVTVHASGNDVNGNIRKYYWSFDNAVFSDSTATGVIKRVFTVVGVHVVFVKVRDDDGIYSGADTVRVTVSIAPLNTGLLAYFPLDGNANDLSGNNHNGTPIGTSAGIDRFLKPNGALVFDGTTSQVTIPDSPGIRFGSNDFTVSAWIYSKGLTGNNGYNNIISKHDADDNSFLLSIKAPSVGASSGKTTFGICLLTQDYSGSANVDTGAWHHVAVTRTGTSFSIYTDGVLDGTFTNTKIFSTTTAMLLGSQGNVTNQKWKGSLDDIRLYGRALTAIEIDQLYHKDGWNGNAYNPDRGRIAYYPFDGNANDESGNGNTGVVHSAALTADRFGNPNSAYSFDGVSSYISVANSSALLPPNAITLTAWVLLTDTTGPRAILGIPDNPGGGYLFKKSDLANKLRIEFFPFSDVTNSVGIPYQEWVFASVTYNRDSVKIYQNGMLTNSAQSTLPINFISKELLIGAIPGPGQFFKGKIDDIRIYNRALSSNEIDLLYRENNWAGNVDTCMDIDGNVYNTVTIGTQTWMVENLKTIRYNDGTAIPLVTSDAAWAGLASPGYCWQSNDPTANKATYGALYNWFAVNTGKLAPIGWHVPTDPEWTTLTTFLGGENIAGGKLKESGLTHWSPPNTGATNETGFTALPGGYRGDNGLFNNFGGAGYWLSATTSWCRDMHENRADVSRVNYSNIVGFSVRCVKN